ncbi:hypothetical protein V2G26_001519 [Clonostachys chloroleuca]
MGTRLGNEQARFIESWRRFIPNRVEREDPFAESPFGMRPSTQLSFHPPQNPEPSRRASTRLSFFRAATPLFGRSSTPAQASAAVRPATVLGLRSARDDHPGGKRGFFRRLLHRGYKEKRARSTTPEPFFITAEPIRLNFLFVGPRNSGQTSLLFRSRYGYFPDATAINRTCYEVYENHRVYDSQPATIEL